jgi:hypothetical protein
LNTIQRPKRLLLPPSDYGTRTTSRHPGAADRAPWPTLYRSQRKEIKERKKNRAHRRLVRLGGIARHRWPAARHQDAPATTPCMFWMKPDLDSGTAVPPAALLPEVVCVQAVLDQRHKECVRGQRHGGHGIPPSNLPGEFSWRRCCPHSLSLFSSPWRGSRRGTGASMQGGQEVSNTATVI